MNTDNKDEKDDVAITTTSTAQSDQKSDTSSDSKQSSSNNNNNNTTSNDDESDEKVTEEPSNTTLTESDFVKLSEMISKAEKLKATGNEHFKKKVYHLAINDYDAALNYIELQCKYNLIYSKYFSKKSKSNLKDCDTNTQNNLQSNYEYTTENINKMNNIAGAIYNNRAFCYFRIELYGAAVTDSSNAVNYKFWKAYYRRGCSNAALGKWGKAKKDFDKALRKFPNNKDIKNKLKQATKAYTEEKFYKAIETEKGKPIWETIKLDDFGAIPESYKGPRLDSSTDITSDWVLELQQWQKDGNLVHIRVVVELILKCIEIFEKCKNVEYYEHSDASSNNNKITVCGDVHGQYWDYLNIFDFNGIPSENNPYLFNGDFVDRGSWSCEIIISMMAWKYYNKNIFHMTRGNHETTAMNAMYGFEGECEKKYNKTVFKLFTEMFNYLPIAYVLGKQVFVCHGGLFKEPNVTISDLQNKIDRNNQPNVNDVFSDCLWSDPQDANGLAPSKRGGGTMFGPDITSKFLSDNNLKLLIRSHEVQEEGYKVAHNGKCITIFSAPNYIDQMGNKGAIIKLDENYEPTFKQFEAVPHPDIKPMAYAKGPMGFGNFFT